MVSALSILKPDLPFLIQVEITSQCNLRCKMCPLTASSTPSSITPGHIQDVVWQEILPMAREVGQVIIGGFGEPLVHRHCVALLQELERANIWIGISTNGTALTPAIAAELTALRCLMNINVSIDSPDATVYREIRGGKLEQALNGLRNLMACMDNPYRVSVSSVVMASNIATLRDFPPLLGQLGVKYYILQGLLNYHPDNGGESIVDIPNVLQDVEQIRAACAAAGVELVCTLPDRLDSEVRGDAQRLSLYYEREAGEVGHTKMCNLAWEIPYIDKDGKVYPCCYAASQATAVLGDLRSERLADVWGGERYQQFRAGILDGRTMPEVCRGCTTVPLGQHQFHVYAARVLLDESLLHGTMRPRLVVQNIGSRTWRQADMIRIGTAHPRQHASLLASPGWISPQRVGSFVEECVPPGGRATFDFSIQPSQGVVSDTFQLLAEGQCWMPNTRFRVSLDGAVVQDG